MARIIYIQPEVIRRPGRACGPRHDDRVAVDRPSSVLDVHKLAWLRGGSETVSLCMPLGGQASLLCVCVHGQTERGRLSGLGQDRRDLFPIPIL